MKLMSSKRKKNIGIQSVDTCTNTEYRYLYSNSFFINRQKSIWKSAVRIVSKVLEVIQPSSVIDVGCGTGEFLAVFQEHGIDDILGIDGAYVPQNFLAIPRENFMSTDLSIPFTFDRTYDLAICLEVAEHLSPQSARNFITSLTCLAPIVLFSAAIPYQGGTHHVNEQWPEYWANLFKMNDFVPVDALRQSIWNDIEINVAYRQNILFFCNEEMFTRNEKLFQAYKTTKPDVLSMVHPDMYLASNILPLRMLRCIINLPILTPLLHLYEKRWKRFLQSSKPLVNK